MNKLFTVIGCLFLYIQTMADKAESNKPEPISGVLIMKVKPEFRSSCSEMRVTGHALDALFNRIGVQRSSKVFPEKFPESGASKKTPDKRVDLSLIYEVTWSASLSAENVCGQIMATGMVEYAEPRYLPQLLYTPNDPALGGQYEHPLLKSFDAWNISLGDTNVVVGISDTGVDIDHEDLVGNIRYNYNDPINGVDDDGDGYTDNFRGWDLGENDNDPSSNEAGKHHGVFVSGLAGATTDNGLGMAGTGFRCKFLPLKISDKNGGLTRGFESIVYAADHGCAVINCSWGIKGIKSQYGQDIINYAVFNEDALVVAAAGNDNDAIPFYPASFDNVLSVAATGPQDVKWGGSSYGPKVDLSAPGEQVYSTWNGNGYIRSSGTSFSSPITAGCAGVLRSYFPELDVAQVTALLKSTTDFIDTISGNEAYAGYLGTGRLNLYRALTESGGPAIELDAVSVTDMYEDQFQPGDTLYIVASLHNYMAPSDSIHMRIASLSPFASLLDSTAVIAGLNTLGTGSNNADPFVVVISPSAPSNSVLDFMLTYSDTMYESQSPFSVNVNQDYVDITINRVHTSVNGNGNLGFSLPDQQNGLGVIVDQSPNLLYEAGLMIAANGYVSDNRMNAGNNGNESDFYNVTPIKVIPSATADHETYTVYNDAGAGGTSLNIEVRQRTLAWQDAPHNGYVMVEYTLVNKNASSIEELYCGLYTDWDIQDHLKNRAGYEATKRLGYTYNIQPGGYYGGVKVLSSENASHYSIDNNASGFGGVVLTDGFSVSEKTKTLTTNRHTAGSQLGGADVINVVSSGPYTIAAGDSVKVAFALLAAPTLDGLIDQGQDAQILYDPTLTGVPTVNTNQNIHIFPNPANTSVSVHWPGEKVREVRLTTISGQVVRKATPSASDQQVTWNLTPLPAGVYLVEIIHTTGQNSRQKIIISH